MIGAFMQMLEWTARVLHGGCNVIGYRNGEANLRSACKVTLVLHKPAAITAVPLRSVRPHCFCKTPLGSQQGSSNISAFAYSYPTH